MTTSGVAFSADQFFTAGKSFSASPTLAVAGTVDDVLYRTERSAASFSYSIPVINGVYDVRLHFAEIYWGVPNGGAGGTGKRRFNVNLEGGAVELANFDMNAIAAPATSIIRTYRTTITDGKVDLAFAATINEAKISAIEVLPVDTTAPGQLSGVTATGAATGITVGWTGSTAADRAGYNVYRATSAAGTYTKVNAALITGTTYADAAAPAGATSYYQVTAVDTTGNESVRSVTVSAAQAGSHPAHDPHQRWRPGGDCVGHCVVRVFGPDRLQ